MYHPFIQRDERTVRDYSVILTNTVKKKQALFLVVLPSDQKWMTSGTPLDTPSIAGGDSAVVVLRLAATDDEMHR